MSIKNYLKEESKRERQKLSQMSGRDKLWYIWEYYKFHIIATILVIGLAVSIGTAIYSNRFDNALYMLVLNDKSGGENSTEEMSQSLEEYLKLGKDEQVLIDDSLSVSFDSTTTEMGYASLAKITALITTKDLDVIIADTASMEHFGGLGAFTDLGKELPADLYELVKDHLYYTISPDGVSYPCAISLESTDFSGMSGVKLTPPYLGILSNTQHKEASLALIRYLFE